NPLSVLRRWVSHHTQMPLFQSTIFSFSGGGAEKSIQMHSLQIRETSPLEMVSFGATTYIG
ncbi:MAG: hypothetical protein ACJ71J_15680, partial [Nitrososphaeraceae archaeon]